MKKFRIVRCDAFEVLSKETSSTLSPQKSSEDNDEDYQEKSNVHAKKMKTTSSLNEKYMHIETSRRRIQYRIKGKRTVNYSYSLLKNEPVDFDEIVWMIKENEKNKIKEGRTLYFIREDDGIMSLITMEEKKMREAMNKESY